MKIAHLLPILGCLAAGGAPAAPQELYKPLDYIPRSALFQEGGDLGAALRDGFGIVLDVRMTADGRLDGVDETLALVPGGRSLVVRWRTEDRRSLSLFAAALARHPSLFEKDYAFLVEGSLASEAYAKFIWPRYISPYRLCASAAEALTRFNRGESPIVVRDAARIYAEMAALASAKPEALSDGQKLSRAVSQTFLPPDADRSSWSEIYRRLVEADVAADSKWRRIKDRAEYERCRQELRAKMREAIGPLPERTPLNFKRVRTFEKGTYRVEHVTFESMPGLVVPANLFVPTDPAFKAPYPAVVMSCGHGRKDGDIYRRACVDVVRRGMVVLMFEPYEQGERVQYSQYDCCQNHNLIGLKAMLLGSSMAALRIWDGIRAIDCAQTLPFVDASRIGYMGNSGGGTMTSLMESVDDRIVAAAPGCYLTSFGYLCRTMGPQDAEQNIFGQLAFGLNHTGYVLLSDAKVLVTVRYDDMFAYGGTAQLMETVRDVAGRIGRANDFALNGAHGPHGWVESTLQGSADWMSAWLQGRTDLLPFENGRHRLDDLGFSAAKSDRGFSEGECGVFAGQSPFADPKARDIHQILREKFANCRAARPARTAAETAAMAKRMAGVLPPAESGLVVREVASEDVAGCRVTRLAVVYPSGFALPATLLERADAKATSSVLLAGAKGRVSLLPEARAALGRGQSAQIVDVTGTGDIGKQVHHFYGADDTPEEGVSIMLYLLGESMTGRRATELAFAADWLKARTGAPVTLRADGSVAIAAAHAFAAERGLFSDVRVTNAPPSWTEFLEKPGVPFAYRYTWCVNGALCEYDWVDLVK